MSLIYRGTSSDDVKFNVTERRVYNAPAFDVSGIEVPGRSGDILNSQERFKNKSIVYTGFIRSSDFPGDTTWERLSRGLRTIKAWVCGDAGKYHDLTDDYDPGFVRRAFVSGETAISEVLDRPDGATITITFMAEPFMYEESDPIELPETGTASGAIASFEGVAAPLQSLKFNIEPSQDLHGYSYPWPAGGGKNKFYTNLAIGSFEKNGLTFTVREDGQINVRGTATANTFQSIGYFTPQNEVSYILNGCPSGGSTSTYRMTLLTVGYDTGNGLTFTGAGTQLSISVDVYNGRTVDLMFKPMIRLVSETDPTYAPYSNICPISGWSQVDGKQSGDDMTDYTPITISLGQTVYGGYEDALNGKLTLTHAYESLDGTGWTWDSNNGLVWHVVTGGVITNGTTQHNKYIKACNMFIPTSWGRRTYDGDGTICMYYGQTRVAVKWSQITSASDAATLFNGTPLQVVYELATPIEIDLTPVNVSSVLGQNNIWCNTGDTEVVYVEPTENPTEWPSKPRLEITMAGAGTLTVNGKTWSIGSYTGTLICDSEIMDWYDASNLKNSLVSGDGFPELQPGENIITYTGGITKVVAKPRWRTL